MKSRFLAISLLSLGLLASCGPVTPFLTIESPTITPTFDISKIVTVTPAEAAVCPNIDPTLQPNLGLPDKLNQDNPFIIGLEKSVLSFLNRGGDYHKIITEIRNYYARLGANLPYPIAQDLTGDSVPEIIMRDESSFHTVHIFSCRQGKYVDFIPLHPDETAWPVDLYKIDDLNANGLPEVLLKSANWIGIFEWDGEDFRILNPTSQQ